MSKVSYLFIWIVFIKHDPNCIGVEPKCAISTVYTKDALRDKRKYFLNLITLH